MVKKKAEFTVETISAGHGEVLVYVEDPAGHREEVSIFRSILGRVDGIWGGKLNCFGLRNDCSTCPIYLLG